ncbi:MAG: hypothetical protein MRY83_21045 [Flavobacteriales bacterium]|nr:hypothetical protein [Flavobacteriales bacterium]
MKKTLPLCFAVLIMFSCGEEYVKEKGVTLEQAESFGEEEENQDGVHQNQSSLLKTKPGKVILTGDSNHRLIPVFKINYNKKRDRYFTGSLGYHYSYSDDFDYFNYMPGVQATYGYNMLNVSHYDLQTKKGKNLFGKPVLINTIYYPSYSQDSLKDQPVNREFYLISAYDEDTNNDSIINHKDLRRFYYFDIDGNNQTNLIPTTHSVVSSQYDAANDVVYIHARLDENKNGKRDPAEQMNVFWIDLKNPKEAFRMY